MQGTISIKGKGDREIGWKYLRGLPIAEEGKPCVGGNLGKHMQLERKECACVCALVHMCAIEIVVAVIVRKCIDQDISALPLTEHLLLCTKHCAKCFAWSNLNTREFGRQWRSKGNTSVSVESTT